MSVRQEFLRKRWAALIVMSLPLAVLAGCTPPTSESLAEFVTDFVRSALAAWLL